MTLAETLRAAVVELERQHAGFALVGGLAVSVRAEPRFTRDVDLAVVVVDDADAERRVRGFVLAGFSVDTAVEQVARGRLATVRLRTEGAESGLVDLLFASSGIEGDVVARATTLEVLPGLRLPVASTGDLVALKLLARDDDDRPQDAVDLRVLSRAAGHEDWAVAATACQAIMASGFHRDRDLLAALAFWRGS